MMVLKRNMNAPQKRPWYIHLFLGVIMFVRFEVAEMQYQDTDNIQKVDVVTKLLSERSPMITV